MNQQDHLLSLLSRYQRYHAWIRSATAIGATLLFLTLIYLPFLIFTDASVSGTLFAILLIFCPFLCIGAVYAAAYGEDYFRVKKQLKQAMEEYLSLIPSSPSQDTSVEATVVEVPAD